MTMNSVKCVPDIFNKHISLNRQIIGAEFSEQRFPQNSFQGGFLATSPCVTFPAR